MLLSKTTLGRSAVRSLGVDHRREALIEVAAAAVANGGLDVLAVVDQFDFAAYPHRIAVQPIALASHELVEVAANTNLDGLLNGFGIVHRRDVTRGLLLDQLSKD